MPSVVAALQAAVEHDVHPAARRGLAIGGDIGHALARETPAHGTRQELGLVEHDLAPCGRPRPADQIGVDPAQDLASLVVVAVVNERARVGIAGAAVLVDDQRMAGLAAGQLVDRMQVVRVDPGGSVECLDRGRDRGGDHAVALAMEQIDPIALEPGEWIDAVLIGERCRCVCQLHAIRRARR